MIGAIAIAALVLITIVVTRAISSGFLATALSACAGTTGALIPPSIVLIIYGTVAGVSIEQLFMAGVIPGLLIGVGLMVVSARLSHRYDVASAPRASRREVVRTMMSALGAFLLAVIIFVGILAGVFTATEASAVAVVYALFAGLVVYRQITLADLPGIFLSAAKTTAALSFVLACAALFAWTLGIGRIPEVVTTSLLGGTDAVLGLLPTDMDPETFAFLRRITVLLVLNVALLLIGTVIDVAPALLIVVPVLLPVSQAIGMGSGLAAVQFGTLVVSNLVIGLVTPPVGTTLFVASGVGRVDVSQLVPHVLRFLVIMIVAQLLITYVPAVTRTLPALMQ